MTNEQILKKAIERAINNNFDFNNWYCSKGFPIGRICISRKEMIEVILVCGYQSLIFSHDFAKAFWNNIDVCHNCGKTVLPLPVGYSCGNCRVYHKHPTIKNWQYHLQQMVLEPEPLLYLRRFLDEK